jgi:effector-binding domain-containing protein
MISEPKIDERPPRPCATVRTQAPMQDLPTVIPQGLQEVGAWMKRNGIQMASAPFIRYCVIDMAGQLDIELGCAVATTAPGEGRVVVGEIPAGRYATLIYTGPYDGLMAANAALLDWGTAQGLTWDSRPTPQGDEFGGRFEFYISDPGEQPDPAQWETEVAIRLADDPSQA